LCITSAITGKQPRGENFHNADKLAAWLLVRFIAWLCDPQHL
jgi:hypothetical protein